MKTTKLTCYFLFSISFIQISCTSQLFIERTLPPVVSVSENQWKVLIMSRFNPDQLPYKQEKKVEVYADGAIHALAGVVDAIDEDGNYTLVGTDTAGYTLVGSGADLTPAQVQEMYRQQPHHLLLTLDHFDTFLEQEVVREKDEDGDITKTAHYTLFSKSDWTLYDSTGTIFDRATLSWNELYNSRGVISGLFAIGPAISNAGPVINNLARQT
ncbi:hypothetical protein ACFS7Z_11480 [Pontibacter toksunensis]|uniref:Uncharacterized protein n=1 Tax=Pontibacter toksunensis TaxID=1332631 RepID=A0ABW6BVJ5_9BACT